MRAESRRDCSGWSGMAGTLLCLHGHCDNPASAAAGRHPLPPPTHPGSGLCLDRNAGPGARWSVALEGRAPFERLLLDSSPTAWLADPTSVLEQPYQPPVMPYTWSAASGGPRLLAPDQARNNRARGPWMPHSRLDPPLGVREMALGSTHSVFINSP